MTLMFMGMVLIAGGGLVFIIGLLLWLVLAFGQDFER